MTGLNLGLGSRVAIKAEQLGGAEEDRTPDPLRAKQVLSQLSYGPLCLWQPGRRTDLVGLDGFEPATSPLSGVRSHQLSYRPSAKPRDEDKPFV